VLTYETASSVNQTICYVREVKYVLALTPCDRCQQPASFYSTAERTAIDLNLEHPVLLSVTVSVHYCEECDHYFRAQPPFLQRGAIYANRVLDKAVQSVYEDSMAMRQVPTRMARDFWVRPSEGSIRRWCRRHSESFDFATDYQPWVVSEFSGLLCVDEVYQDRLALLLAVDPAAPDGDRLVGYQLVHGSVDATEVERFLTDLRKVGIDPDQVITDGSSLYPTALAKVWPDAAHQLCLFHETRHVTQAAMKAVNATRKRLPQPPPAAATRGGGPLRSRPPSNDPTDAASQRWYWRQAQRHAEIAHVHQLAQQGLSQRAIARQTGHHRQTIKRWLQEPIPPLPENMPADLPEAAALPAPLQRKQQKQNLKRRVHALRQEGLSHSAIARQVGIHRITVKRWLEQDPPSEPLDTPSLDEQQQRPPPPEPWSSWDEVNETREALREHRFLLLHRPENLTVEEQEQVDALLGSPVGEQLRLVRSFLGDWYQLWTDDDGQRRTLGEAKARYEAWRNSATYQAEPHLQRAQQRMTSAKFEGLSQFLRDPEWEATNNGAERAGRAFRHRQAPHFNLRKTESIERSISVSACLRKAVAVQPPRGPFHTCQRGRKRKDRASPTPCAPAA
jgi:lambda repressor-like predicted transcriptional regulator/transposase-like protein